MKRLLLSLIFISCIFYAKAQWSGNAATNNSIVTSSNTFSKTGLVSINDGNNNMILAWVDNRNTATTGTDIYVQKINNDGSLPWGTEKLVCNAAFAQASVSITSDGAGGAILAWGDKRANTGATADEQVYGQRVDASGSMLWTANGVNLTKNAIDPLYYRRSPIIERINTTEFMLVFSQNTATTGIDLYAQKCLITTGAPIWSNDVSIHGAQANAQTTPQIINDGKNGVFVLWSDPRLATTNADIFAQRIKNDGTLMWGVNGRIICEATANQTVPQFTRHTTNGFVAAWTDFRNGNNDIFAQRVDTSGNRLWKTGTIPSQDSIGIAVCVISTSGLNNQSTPKVINDGSNNFILAWNDNRNTGNSTEIYAQKYNDSGSAIWTANGVSVISKLAAQGSGGDFTLVNAASGNVFVVYKDADTGANDIYAQRLNAADGSITAPFTSAGIIICSNTASQTEINTISDGADGLIASWQDSRTTSSGEIYASRLYSNGTLPVTYTKITASVNPNQSVLVKWLIASEINTQKYEVERASDNGTFIKIGTINASKLNEYQFTDFTALTGYNYYRIKAVDFDGTISLSEIATAQLLSLSEFQFMVYPNPTQDVVYISTQAAEAQNQLYQIKLIDLNGAIKMIESFKTSIGLYSLNTSNLTPGTYIIQLVDSNGETKGVKSLIKL